MTLAKYYGEMRTLIGHALPRATVYVYDYGTTDLVDLFEDDETTPIDNPTQADDQGIIGFNVAAGTYDIRCQSGSQTRTYSKVQIGTSGGGGGGGGVTSTWLTVPIPYTAFLASGAVTAASVTLATIPANTAVRRVLHQTSIPYAGGSGVWIMALGTPAIAARYFPYNDLTAGNINGGPEGVMGDTGSNIFSKTATHSLACYLDSQSLTPVNALTAGLTTYHLELITFPE